MLTLSPAALAQYFWNTAVIPVANRAIQTVAGSVNGNVGGSVGGNVNGNVVGSVGSIATAVPGTIKRFQQIDTTATFLSGQETGISVPATFSDTAKVAVISLWPITPNIIKVRIVNTTSFGITWGGSDISGVPITAFLVEIN